MPAPRSEAVLEGLGLFGMRLGLERPRRLLDALGAPHLAVPVVLVAGTNGKGSSAAMLAAMCRAAGYRTGLYTSPHLESVTERLRLDGRPIGDRRLASYLERGLEAAGDGGEPPTYFEALTIAAFLHFRDAGAELAVMEVGLGGRLDATNVCEPVLSVVTSIGLDHEQHLGTTLESVAREKCGIFRRGRPAVARAGSPEIERLLRAETAAAGAALAFADRVDIQTSTTSGACPQRARLATRRGVYDLELPLAGRHQLENLSVAVRAAETLGERGWPALDAAAIRAGAASCRWPGRLERIELGGGRRVLLDAAHNAAGIAALAGHLEATGERPDLLFGALAEKTIDGVVPRLAAAAGRVVVTRAPDERAAPPERWLPLFAGRTASAETDPARALDKALDALEGTLLVCGSIYLVGRTRTLLRERFGVPDPAGESGSV